MTLANGLAVTNLQIIMLCDVKVRRTLQYNNLVLEHSRREVRSRPKVSFKSMLSFHSTFGSTSKRQCTNQAVKIVIREGRVL
jgi:hypothetical protein